MLPNSARNPHCTYAPICQSNSHLWRGSCTCLRTFHRQQTKPDFTSKSAGHCCSVLDEVWREITVRRTFSLKRHSVWFCKAGDSLSKPSPACTAPLLDNKNQLGKKNISEIILLKMSGSWVVFTTLSVVTKMASWGTFVMTVVSSQARRKL